MRPAWTAGRASILSTQAFTFGNSPKSISRRGANRTLRGRVKCKFKFKFKFGRRRQKGGRLEGTRERDAPGPRLDVGQAELAADEEVGGREAGLEHGVEALGLVDVAVHAVRAGGGEVGGRGQSDGTGQGASEDEDAHLLGGVQLEVVSLSLHGSDSSMLHARGRMSAAHQTTVERELTAKKSHCSCSL